MYLAFRGVRWCGHCGGFLIPWVAERDVVRRWLPIPGNRGVALPTGNVNQGFVQNP